MKKRSSSPANSTLSRLLGPGYVVLLITTGACLPAHGTQSGTVYDQVTDPAKRVAPTVTLSGQSHLQDKETLILTAHATVCQGCRPFYFWQADGGTFSGGADFSPVIIWSPSLLNVARSYTISVTMGDGKGEVASSTFVVQVAPTAGTCTLRTDAPLLYNGGIYETGDYEVFWSQVSNATGYVLQESSFDSFASAVETQLVGGTARSQIFSKPNGTYYYRVKSTNACGASAWSGTMRRVVQANVSPEQPSQPYPSNGALGVGLAPALAWTGSDIDGVPDYRIDFGTDAEKLSPLQGFRSDNAHSTTFKMPGSLAANTPYYWRVTARDEKGAETVGPVWTFSTGEFRSDLTLSALHLIGKIANGVTVAASTVVTNLGTAVSPPARVRYYYAQQENTPELEFVGTFSPVPSLAPGASVTINTNLTIAGLTSGTSYVVADLDTTEPGADSDLSNNVTSAALVYLDKTAPSITDFSARGSSGTFKTGSASTLNYSVLDDIGATNVSFAYSLDAGVTFKSIADGIPVTNGGYGNAYSWIVPAELRASNSFMLRLETTDASGNAAARVLGPYSLIDGTAPAGATSSPSAADTWALGSAHVLSWSASSPSGIKSSSVWFYSHGGGQVQKLGDVVGSTDRFNWTIPINSFFVAQDAQIVIRVLDNNNNETRISSPVFAIVDPSLPPAKPWDTPSMPFALAGSKPLLAYDATNTLHLAFTGTDGLTYAKRVGGNWQGPWRLGKSYGADSMALDSDGQVHIVCKR